jgi:hypothetical protein
MSPDTKRSCAAPPAKTARYCICYHPLSVLPAVPGTAVSTGPAPAAVPRAPTSHGPTRFSRCNPRPGTAVALGALRPWRAVAARLQVAGPRGMTVLRMAGLAMMRQSGPRISTAAVAAASLRSNSSVTTRWKQYFRCGHGAGGVLVSLRISKQDFFDAPPPAGAAKRLAPAARH